MNLERALERLRLEVPSSVAGGVLTSVGLAHGFVERPSPIGTLYVAFNDRGVTEVTLSGDPLDFADRYAAAHDRPIMPVARPPERIERHLDRALTRGTPGRLPLDLDRLTEFQVGVLLLAATIPSGEVRTYGWLARELGRPRAVRAVGSALAANPVPLIVPCHRVVRSDGSLGRYSLGSDENKARLLESEGLDVAMLRRLAADGVRFLGSDTSQVFCLPTCRAARRIAARHRVALRSAAEARDAGFRPCTLCRPG